VSWSVFPSAGSHHLVLRTSGAETLPDGLAAKLRDEGVACGWLRASGVLTHVELRAFDGELGSLGSTRRITGPVQVLSMEGSVGMSQGEPSFSLRALLARETDHGLETFAGEIASARIVALEAMVTVLDDVVLERAHDAAAGVWLLGPASSTSTPRPAPARPSPPAAPPAWSGALEASEHAEAEPHRGRPAASSAVGGPMPARPVRPGIDLDTPSPEPGDIVDHFAFGRADVVKSDGERLHLKVHKDGRIREIAVHMLKVARLADTGEGKRHFRLERRL
jgi:predicted DNA-binding protein with PD1-like motif